MKIKPEDFKILQEKMLSYKPIEDLYALYARYINEKIGKDPEIRFAFDLFYAATDLHFQSSLNYLEKDEYIKTALLQAIKPIKSYGFRSLGQHT